MHIACMFQCDGAKASVEACVHWPLLPLRMRRQSPALVTSGSLSGGWEQKRKWPGIREGVGRVAAHSDDIDKGKKPMDLRIPAPNENLEGLEEASRARKDPRG